MFKKPIERVLERLECVKQVSNTQWTALCPAHEDQEPSLSIGLGEDSRVLLTCHAGCSVDSVLAAMNFSMMDLYPNDENHPDTYHSNNPTSTGTTCKKISAMYDYTDEEGDLVYQVVRYEPKDFRQRRPDGKGGYIWNMNGVSRVLYHLPEIVSSSPDQWIFITEGEKDADALSGIGLLSTSNSGGAGKWSSIDDISVLEGRWVAIIPDCDEPGYRHGQDVARSLQGIASDVRIIDLRVINGMEGKDVSDWLDWLDCREPEELRDSLLAMAEKAPEFEGDDWPLVMPIESSSVDEIDFPVKVLPTWLRDMVQSVAISTQTPLGLAGTNALGILSLCCSGKVKVQPRSDWSESLSLFLVVAFPSGARKSPVFDIMLDPLRQWESDRINQLRSKRARERERRTILQKKLHNLEKQAISDNGENAIEEAIDIAEKLEDMKLPVLPRLFASDVTPEGVGRLMSEQGGCIGICSPEGAEVIDIMGGRYSGTGKPNLDVYLKGHTGESIRIDRASRDSDAITVNHPFLTISICLQPCVLEAAWKRQDFSARGLLGRFLCSYPKHRLGYREIDPPCVPKEVKDTYHKSIASLLDTFRGNGHIDQPYAMKLTPEAEETLRSVRENNERKLRPGMRYGNNFSWGGKLDGTIIRIAGLLNLAENPTERCPWSKPITANILNAAVSISEYFEGQLSRVQGKCGGTPEARIAHRILRWIKGNKISRFSQRDAYRGLGSNLGPDDVEAPLEALEASGYIRKVQSTPKERSGQKPSPTWEVNPKWIGGSVSSVMEESL